MSTRVMIVDDHAMFREGLKSLIQKQEDLEAIGEAKDGQEAVEMAAELKPDVIVMDIVMPRRNGIEATRAIRKFQPDVCIIALTTHADRQYLQEIFKAGARGYLLKDCAFDELAQAIETALSGQFYVSPTLSTLMVDGWVHEDSKEEREADPLSPREREVLQAVAEGLSNKAIAARLYVSIKTVETHRHNIMEKLDLHSIAELTQYAIRKGLITI